MELSREEANLLYESHASQKKAPWLYVPAKVEGWNRVDSFGEIPKSYDPSIQGSSDGSFVFFDLYTNQNGKRLVISQRDDLDMTESLNHVDTPSFKAEFKTSFPKGTQFLHSFGDNLAALMDIQNGRYQLVVYKQRDNNVIRYDVWGNSSPEEMEIVLKKYMNE